MADELVVTVWSRGVSHIALESGLVLMVSAEETPQGRAVLTKLRDPERLNPDAEPLLICSTRALPGERKWLELKIREGAPREELERRIKFAYAGFGRDVIVHWTW